MKPTLPLLIIVLSMVFIVRCSRTHITGTGSEVEARCGINGIVVDGHGKPVHDALVRIRPSKYLAFDTASGTVKADSFTNKFGRFHFDSVPADSYTIEINKEEQYGKTVRLSIASMDTFPIMLPTDTVIRTGSIRGRINLPITDDTARPLIAIYGLEHFEKALMTQDFCFKGIPAGTYNLRVIPYKGSKLILELQNIEVFCDSLTDVGALNLTLLKFFKGCGSWECDSLAVRELLDANGLAKLPVRSVISVDTGSRRVIGLDLAGRKVFDLTKDIGSLSKLKYLSVQNNAIRSVPQEISYLNSLVEFIADSNEIVTLPYEIGYCTSLRSLFVRCNRLAELNNGFARLSAVRIDLSGNRLQTVPDNIGMMVGLRSLFLDNNNITGLPRTITSLRLNEFSIRNNRLCTVSDTLTLWISQYDSTWVSAQTCAQK